MTRDQQQGQESTKQELYRKLRDLVLRDAGAEYMYCAESMSPVGTARTKRKRRQAFARQQDLERVARRLDLLLLAMVSSRVGDQSEEEREYPTFEDYDPQIPHFKTEEELDAWWEKQPKVKAEVDPRLLEKVKTSIRLNRKVIDGYDFLAKQLGLRSGQTLMKVVLDNYLAKNLPPDF